MNYRRCMYYVEGQCEEQLINVLKAEPRRLTPGKVKVHNIIQEEIPRREVNMISQGTTVVFVYDTDVEKTDVLKKNIDHVMKYASQAKIVHLAQVLYCILLVARSNPQEQVIGQIVHCLAVPVQGWEEDDGRLWL